MTKADKYMGLDSPNVRRRTDPVPERPTPKAVSDRARKNYGFTIESRGLWRSKGWKRRIWTWHETAKARDQAMAAFAKKHAKGSLMADFYRNPEPIDR